MEPLCLARLGKNRSVIQICKRQKEIEDKIKMLAGGVSQGKQSKHKAMEDFDPINPRYISIHHHRCFALGVRKNSGSNHQIWYSNFLGEFFWVPDPENPIEYPI